MENEPPGRGWGGEGEEVRKGGRSQIGVGDYKKKKNPKSSLFLSPVLAVN